MLPPTPTGLASPPLESHTARLATGHELALIHPDELASELASVGLEIDEQEDYFPPTQNAALSWPLRFVSAKKITRT
ncbi:hypothetical protein G3N30_08150 [Microbacterium lacticum]|uniref:hypothetical protein n=1 Tax=Microbacterium lacticum TaxID=33885 RepID=UPI0018B04D41|nr:hypothetical protein [Microbacterium lacticum]MBF9336198.1 hypothetical protein [Microbacterium lacticum]